MEEQKDDKTTEGYKSEVGSATSEKQKRLEGERERLRKIIERHESKISEILVEKRKLMEEEIFESSKDRRSTPVLIKAN